MADDLEPALRAEAGVHDCAVRVRGHGDAARRIAYVVPRGPLARDALLRRLGEGPPASIVELPWMPLTEEGDVDERALLAAPVVDGDLLARWESRARSVPGIGEAVTVERPGTPSRPAVPAPALEAAPRPRGGPSARAPSGPGDGAARPPAIAEGEPLAGEGALPRSLAALLERAAREGGRAGIVCVGPAGEETALSYAALLERARAVAGGLRRRGLRPGDRVILEVEAIDGYLESFWGAVLAGVVPAPVTASASFAQGKAADGRLLATWTRLGRCPVVAAAPKEPPIEVLPLADLRRGPPLEEVHHASLEDVAVMLLTSGSTGAPEAAQLTHGNLVRWCASVVQRHGDTGADASLSWMPLDHAGSLIDFHLRGVFLGAPQVHVATRRVAEEPLRWLDLIHRHRPAVTWAPNFAFASLARRAEEIAAAAGRWDLACVRRLINAGEAVDVPTAERLVRVLAPHGLAAAALRPTWGMSETCSGALYGSLRPGGAGAEPHADVGGPIPGVAVRVVGPAGELLREGEEGRLEIRGVSVTRGYFGAPPRDAEGWLDTGDLARIDGGRVTITGREKDVIVHNGAKRHPRELEAAIEEVEGVAGSFTAVCALRSEGGDAGRFAVFFHPAAGDDDASLRALLGAIKRRVGERFGMAPALLVPVPREAIPKTAIGKLQRRRLREELEAGRFDAILRRVERLAGAGTLPAWFHRVVWRRRRLAPAPPDERGPVLVVAAAPLGPALAGALARRGRRAVALPPDEAPRLAAHLEGTRPHVLLAAEAGEAEPAALASLLLLVQALGGREADLTVASIEEAARPAPSLAGALLRAAAAEHPGLRCRAVALPAAMPSPEREERLLAELSARDEDEVSYAGGERRCPRLEAVSFSEEAAGARSPFERGGLYLLAGGAGGIGRLLARHLLERYAARLLLVGRAPPGETLRELEGLPGEVEVAAADIADAARLREVVAGACRRAGRPLDGVIHLAGEHAARPLAEETPETLAAGLRAKREGARALADLLEGRPDALFLAFSSVASFFGGAGLGAYAAAGRSLEALVEERIARGATRTFCVAWTPWDRVGMNREGASEAATAALGYRTLPPGQALLSLEVALRRGPGALLVGLDDGRPHVRRFLSEAGAAPPPSLTTFYTVAGAEPAPAALAALDVRDRHGARAASAFVRLAELPRAGGAIDREALRRSGERAGGGDGAAASPLEADLAAIWREVLAVGRVDRRASFFELGGDSLRSLQMLARVQSRLGIVADLAALMRAPTLAELAKVLEGRRSEAGPAAEPIAPAPRGDRLPLATSQERHWRIHRLEPLGSFFNVTPALRLRGALDRGALERSLQEIVRRHEALRTTIVPAPRPEGGEADDADAVQRIAPFEPFALALVEAAGTTPAEREAAARAAVADLGGRPFDLTRDAPRRFALVRLGPEEHVLAASMPHALADGESEAAFCRELAALYAAFAAGRPSPLPELPFQLADFAVWQRRALRGPAQARLAAYWREHLEGAPCAIPLPLDHPRPPRRNRRARPELLALPPSLRARLEATSHRLGGTPFMAMRAVFDVLLARWSGQSDLVVGTPMANRPLEAEDLLGCFNNTLPIRVALRAGDTGVSHFERVKAAALAGYAHRDLATMRIADLVPAARLANPYTLTNVLLNLPGAVDLASFPGLAVTPFPKGGEVLLPGFLDLMLLAPYGERGKGLDCLFFYAADLFERATIVDLARRFEELLRDWVERPEAPVASLGASPSPPHATS